MSVHGDKRTEMLGPCRSVPPHPPRSAVRVKNQLSHLIVAPGAVDWDVWHSLGIPKPRQLGPISLESTTSAGCRLGWLLQQRYPPGGASDAHATGDSVGSWRSCNWLAGSPAKDRWR